MVGWLFIVICDDLVVLATFTPVAKITSESLFGIRDLFVMSPVSVLMQTQKLLCLHLLTDKFSITSITQYRITSVDLS